MTGLICVPHTGTFPWQFVAASHGMKYPDGVGWCFFSSALVYESREKLAKQALAYGCDWLLFLDSDMVPPEDLIPRMLAHNRPMVGALAYRRVPPYDPCIYDSASYDAATGEFTATRPAQWKEGLIRVAATGMACVLIRREVLETVPEPWFWPLPGAGEDLAFCLRVNQAGIPINVDTSVVCGHVGSIVVPNCFQKGGE